MDDLLERGNDLIFEKHHYSKATIDVPVEIFEHRKYINVEVLAIWVYDLRTGEIMLKKQLKEKELKTKLRIADTLQTRGGYLQIIGHGEYEYDIKLDNKTILKDQVGLPSFLNHFKTDDADIVIVQLLGGSSCMGDIVFITIKKDTSYSISDFLEIVISPILLKRTT